MNERLRELWKIVNNYKRNSLLPEGCDEYQLVGIIEELLGDITNLVTPAAEKQKVIDLLAGEMAPK